MTFSTPVDELDLVDFTVERRPIRFRVDQDIFTCYPTLGLASLQDLARRMRGFGQLGRELTEVENEEDVGDERFQRMTERIGQISTMFDVFMEEESAARFRERLVSRTEPLDIQKQVIPILHWVLERYGLRPTTPSSSSSTGSDDGTTSTSSTAGAPTGESIS